MPQTVTACPECDDASGVRECPTRPALIRYHCVTCGARFPSPVTRPSRRGTVANLVNVEATHD